MTKRKKRKSRARQEPTKPVIPSFNGDHGTGTRAANMNTTIEKLEGPNNFARRRKIEAYEGFVLSMRQTQAAKAIRDAYCRVESLTSGSPLKEHVDGSPKPDAAIASQVDAQSRLVHVMRPVPRAMRPIVEHILWHNQTANTLPGMVETHRANFKIAMDLVANHLRY